MSDEPAPRVYQFRKPYCLACQQVIGEDEKSLKAPEGFLHAECFTFYEEALDLIEATKPKDAA